MSLIDIKAVLLQREKDLAMQLELETIHGESKEDIRGYCPHCGISIGTSTATKDLCDGINHDGPFMEICIKCIRLHYPRLATCKCGLDLESYYVEEIDTFILVYSAITKESTLVLLEKGVDGVERPKVILP